MSPILPSTENEYPMESAYTDPQSITVDLGAVDTIHTLVLDWENAAAASYTIQLSSDNSNWTTVQTVTGNTNGGIKTYSGINSTGRYVKVAGTKRTTTYGYSIWELQVLGTVGSSAMQAPVISSSPHRDGLAERGVLVPDHGQRKPGELQCHRTFGRTDDQHGDGRHFRHADHGGHQFCPDQRDQHGRHRISHAGPHGCSRQRERGAQRRRWFRAESGHDDDCS